MVSRNLLSGLSLALCLGLTLAYDWPEDCGTIAKMSPKIVGGRDAEPGTHPSIARVSANGGICGGTLISPELVLTAAHCVRARGKNLAPGRIRVVTGDHDQSKLNGPDDAEQHHKVKSFSVHPGYNADRQWENDLAILKISPPAQINERVRSACLPKEDSMGQGKLDGKQMTVSGWGLKDNGQLATTLQEADIYGIESEDKCEASDLKVAFCAGVDDNSVSACNGDDGGPLMLKQEGKDHLVGVVGKTQMACSVKGSPGVFARVTASLEWINKEADRL